MSDCTTPATLQLAYMAGRSAAGAVRLNWDRARYAAAYLLQRITEAQVQKAVLEELARLGIDAWPSDAGAAQLRGRIRGEFARAPEGSNRSASLKYIMGGRAGAGGKGLPDISGYLPDGTGRTLFVECKAPEWRELKQPGFGHGGRVFSDHQIRPPGKLKPEQRAFLERAISRNCCAGVVWHPKDLALFLPEEYARRLG